MDRRYVSQPRCYDTLITVLESYNEENLTVNLVKSKLVEEYKRSMEKAIKSSDNYRLGASTNLECFFCKGHLKKDCRTYQEWKKKNPEKAGRYQHANRYN